MFRKDYGMLTLGGYIFTATLPLLFVVLKRRFSY